MISYSLILWSLFFLGSVLFEILISPGLFFFLSFSIGAAASLIATFFGVGIIYEFIIFFVVTGLAFAVLTKVVKKISRGTLHKTNIYALQGKQGVVTESISHCQKGWVKIDGELWAAFALENELIEKGEMVEVISMAGSHVKVRKSKGYCKI